jgi:hypothetical protein
VGTVVGPGTSAAGSDTCRQLLRSCKGHTAYASTHQNQVSCVIGTQHQVRASPSAASAQVAGCKKHR